MIKGLHSLDVYDYFSRYSFREPGFLKYHKYNEQALQVLKRPHRPAPVKEREEKGISYVAEPRISFVPINKLIVEDSFDVRESEAVTEVLEDSASGCTELKYLKRERKLVEASFDHLKTQQNQVLNPFSMGNAHHPRSAVNAAS